MVGVLLWSGCGGMVDPLVLGLVVELLVVFFGYFGSEGVLIICCSIFCSIDNF